MLDTVKIKCIMIQNYYNKNEIILISKIIPEGNSVVYKEKTKIRLYIKLVNEFVV